MFPLSHPHTIVEESIHVTLFTTVFYMVFNLFIGSTFFSLYITTYPD